MEIMNKNLPYYLGFSFCYGIGPMKFKLLLARFGNIKEAYEAPKDALFPLLGINLTEKFIAFRSKFDDEKEIKKITEKNIQVIVQEDPSYPLSLKNITDPPICLYVKGEIKNVDFARNLLFAVVGTRKPTPYGQQVAGRLAYELAAAGCIIVSGMAMGIDTIAHQSAIRARQKTIAVLGCGVDIIYPAINTNLYNNIIAGGGLVISEFPPGHTVMPGLFIARNRLISGLSRGILVVEGLEDSGSLITARYAAEQGKEVFAPPSPITSAQSAAPNMLIKQGAKLVTGIEDIIEEFGLKVIPKKKAEIEADLNGVEKEIFNQLQSEAKTINELVELTEKTVETVLNTLSMLEIKGVVEKNSEGKYQIKM